MGSRKQLTLLEAESAEFGDDDFDDDIDEQIRDMARQDFKGGARSFDCPFVQGTGAAQIWMGEFLALAARLSLFE